MVIVDPGNRGSITEGLLKMTHIKTLSSPNHSCDFAFQGPVLAQVDVGTGGTGGGDLSFTLETFCPLITAGSSQGGALTPLDIQIDFVQNLLNLTLCKKTGTLLAQ